MSRIKDLFQKKQKNVCSIFITAGFPQKESLFQLLPALQSAGVDMIEIGMPFSDPLADGPTIQQSNQVAIANGMTIATLLEQLTDIRKNIQIPLILMGYLNPVLQFGIENFLQKSKEIGIDGLILPDLPPSLYETEYKSTFEKYGIKPIFLITPRTTENRIRYIDNISSGFIYAVATAGTTGSNQSISDSLDYFKKLKEMQLKNPIVAGFNIKDKASFEQVCLYAQGAIIGSAFIKAVSENKQPVEQIVKSFVKNIFEVS
jgi:tryptophan synthase alpha chain